MSILNRIAPALFGSTALGIFGWWLFFGPA
jgi:hypothetical protein